MATKYINTDLNVKGNLYLDGEAFTVNTTTVEVEDNILELNRTQGSPDAATATTSGIRIYRGDGVTPADFIFDDADDTWDLTNNLNVAGTITGSLTGNASTASKWATARTITLGGDLTGNVSIDGSANVTLTAAVVNDSHTHDSRYYTETEIGNFFSGITAITGYNKSNWDSAYSYSQVGHLPLAGGTLTDDLIVKDGELYLDSTTLNGTNDRRIRFTEQISGAGYQGAYIYYNADSNLFQIGTHQIADSLVANDVYAIQMTRGTGNVEINNNLTVGGTITATGGNSTNWNTAYGWGDWSVGVNKAFVDALNVDADTLDGQQNTSFFRSLGGGTGASIDSYTDNGFRTLSYTGYSSMLWSTNAGGSTGTVQMEFEYNTPSRGFKIRNKTDNNTWSSVGWVAMTTANQGHISGNLLHTNNYTSTITKSYIDGLGINATNFGGLSVGNFIRDLGDVNVTNFDTLSDGWLGSNETTATNQPYANHHNTFTITNDASAGRKTQLFFGDSSQFYFRTRQGDTVGWHDWEKVLTSVNYSSTLDARYYTETEADGKFLLNTTDTFTGDLTVTGEINSYGDIVAGGTLESQKNPLGGGSGEGGGVLLRKATSASYSYQWLIDNYTDYLRFVRQDDGTAANGFVGMDLDTSGNLSVKNNLNVVDGATVAGSMSIGQTSITSHKLYINGGSGTNIPLKVKNEGTGTSNYSEIHIANNAEDKLILGSIGSNYTSTDWANSSYVYDTGQSYLRIKASNQLEFFSGGYTVASHKRMIIDSTGDVTIYKNLSVDGKVVAKDWFVSDENTSIAGSSPYDWVHLGAYSSDASRATAVQIGDIDGARYAIMGGGYDLTFAKHLGTSNTWSNIMRFEALGVDSVAGVRILNDLTVDGDITALGTYNLTLGHDSTQPAIFADNVLRIMQRTEVFGGAGGYYLDVRNSSGDPRVRLYGSGGDSYFLDGLALGTTSANKILHIQSNDSAWGTMRLYRDSTTQGEVSIGFFDKSNGATNEAWVIGTGGWGHSGDFVIGNENGGAGGNVRLLVQRDGAVGIGTTSPSAKLVVAKNGINEGTISFDDESNNSHLTLQGEDARVRLQIGTYNNGSYGGWIQASYDNNPSGTGSSGTEPLILNPQGGNVGIGTTGPSQKLDVSGNIKLGNQSGQVAAPNFIDLGNNYSDGYTRDKCKIFLYNSGSEQYGFSVGQVGDVQYHSNVNHDHYIGNVRKTRLNSTTLDVYSSLRAGNNGYDSTPKGTAFSHTLAANAGTSRVVNFDGNGQSPSVWWTSQNNAIGAIDGLSATEGLSFWSNSTAGAWERNFYFKNGKTVFERNVGIGTTSPQEALHVGNGVGIFNVSDNWQQSTYRTSLFRGGNFESAISNQTNTLKIFPATSSRAVGNYWGGIEFMHLDPENSSWGTSYTGAQMWIGGRIVDQPGQERSAFVIATNNSTTAGTHPTERFTVLPNGNVGIGTTSPSAKLEVVGEAWVGNGTDGIKLSYSAGNSTGIVDTEYTSTGLEFRVGGSEKMRINSSGNVGIGTDNPNHRVDIYSNENVPLRIHRPNNANLDSSGAWGIGFSTRGDGNTSTTDTRAGIFSYYNGNLFLATGTSSIVSDPDAYARLTITNAGNVGIGTGSPYEKLEVNGGISATGTANRSASQGQSISLNVESGYGILTSVDWGAEFKPMIVQGKTIQFKTGTGSTSARMFIDNGGNVGIGTTSPGAKLDVSGEVKATNFTSTNSSTSTAMTLSYSDQNKKIFNSNLTFTFTGAGIYYFSIAFGGSGAYGFDITLTTGRNGNYRNFGTIKDSGYMYWETDGDFSHHAQGPLNIIATDDGGMYLDSVPSAFLANNTTDTSQGTTNYSYYIKRYAIYLPDNTTGSNGWFRATVETHGYNSSTVYFLNS